MVVEKIEREQYWMKLARIYELNDERVIQYFKDKQKQNDLLIINLKQESMKMENSEQWFRITNFLRCPNVTNQGLPKSNAANNEQIDFFPKDFHFNWRNFTFSKDDRATKIWEFVKIANGTYSDKTWNKLKSLYGL